MVKVKRKKNSRGRPADTPGCEDLVQELESLMQIFEGNIQVDEDGWGVRMRVLPYDVAEGPEDASTGNLASVQLQLRFDEGYPRSRPDVRLADPVGIDRATLLELRGQLEATAEGQAAQGEPSVWRLYLDAKEFVGDINDALLELRLAAMPRDARAPPPPAPPDPEPSVAASGLSRAAHDPLSAMLEAQYAEGAGQGAWGPGGSLFDEGHGAAGAGVAVNAGAGRGPRAGQAARGLRGSGGGGPTAPQSPSTALAGLVAEVDAAPGMPQGPSPALAPVPAPPALPSLESQLSESLLGVLPAALRDIIQPPRGSGWEGTGRATPGPSGHTSAPASAVRQEVLLGHMLVERVLSGEAASATASGRHALASLAETLHVAGLLSPWMRHLLERQPELVPRICRHLLARHPWTPVAPSRDASGASSLPSRIWPDLHSRLALLMPGGAKGARAAPPVPPPRPPPPAPPIHSRYLADFEERQRLGKGGFGVVYAAENRIDRRLYAIKKIDLGPAEGGALERILREVTTLSRLQHPNVVRYFQSWIEEVTPRTPPMPRPANGNDRRGDRVGGRARGAAMEDSLSEWHPFVPPPDARHKLHTAAATPEVSGGVGMAVAKAVAAPVQLPLDAPMPAASGSGESASGAQLMLAPEGRGAGDGAVAATPRIAARAAGRALRGVPAGAVRVAVTGDGDGESEVESGSESGSETGQGLGESEGWDEGAAESGESTDGPLASEGVVMAPSSGLGLLRAPSAVDEGDPFWDGGGGEDRLWSTTDTPGGTGQGGTTETAQTAQTAQTGTGTGAETAPTRAEEGGGVGAMGARHGGSSESASASDESGSSDEGSSWGGRHRRPPPGPSPPRRLLYIQMEFCPRTLDSVLVDGGATLTDERRWDVLRQLLAGLAHIHAQGIVHRDLKPQNIFLGAATGEIKIGDFGLAKASGGGAEAEEGGRGERGRRSGRRDGETGMVGTPLYMAPEVHGGWAASSPDATKADIYSLGVVACEIWARFTTNSERVQKLQALRERGTVPPEIHKRHAAVARMVAWLCSRDPSQRPSARELLKSDLLPRTVEDEELRVMLRALDKNPKHLDMVMERVFEIGRERAAAATASPLPPGGTAADPLPAADAAGLRAHLSALQDLPGTPRADVAVHLREQVVEALRETLSHHGAAPMTSTALGFLPQGSLPSDAASLLSSAGHALGVRYEMRRPFARWLGAQVAELAADGSRADAVVNLRRYEIATVRRQSKERAGQLPREFTVADIDFLHRGGCSRADGAVVTAELVHAVVESLRRMGLLEDCEVEVRVSHSALLSLLMDLFLGVPAQHRESAAALLASAAKSKPILLPGGKSGRAGPWLEIRKGLEGLGLESSAVEKGLTAVSQLCGPADDACPRLLAALKGDERAALALEECQALARFLVAWGMAPSHVCLDPVIPKHMDCASGSIFQVRLKPRATPHHAHSHGQAPGGTSDTVAVGGRFDLLVKEYWPTRPGVPAAPGAVGATVHIDKLVGYVRAREERKGADGRPWLHSAGLGVMVCAKGGGGLLRERMQICRTLWEAGIRAEMLGAASPSAQEQYSFAQQRGLRWMVLLDHEAFHAGERVTLRSVESARRVEEAVSLSTLPQRLAELLGGRARRRDAPGGQAQTT